jgi:hypothetical protein
MLWLMLIKDRRQPWRFVKSEPPCWKGEIQASIGGLTLVLGWQR